MKKIIVVATVLIMLLGCAGCADSGREAKGAAPGIEYQLSNAYRNFQHRKQMGQAAYAICGGIVIGGVLFKIGAILSGFISGRRLGKRRQEEKRRKAREAWTQDLTDYQKETLRYKKYMAEREKKK